MTRGGIDFPPVQHTILFSRFQLKTHFSDFQDIILPYEFFFQFIYLRGGESREKIRYKKVTVFYELINEICIVFLSPLQQYIMLQGSKVSDFYRV